MLFRTVRWDRSGLLNGAQNPPIQDGAKYVYGSVWPVLIAGDRNLGRPYLCTAERPAIRAASFGRRWNSHCDSARAQRYGTEYDNQRS
jgi:hypothetical protein